MRNKPLIDLAAKKAKREPLTNDDLTADAMTEASRRVALFLGCCPDCWEDMTIIDDRWVCLACRAIAEAMQGG